VFRKKLKVAQLHAGAKLPTRANEHDAGWDLYAAEGTVIAAGQATLVDCGIAIEIPKGYVGFVCPRSGLALKQGATVLNAPGVIDSGYRGRVGVLLHNTRLPRELSGFAISTMEDHELGKVKVTTPDFEPALWVGQGDRIAQLVLQKLPRFKVEWAEELSASDRGFGGFGSSGQ
jgi:dUTP pyrophosphatase